MDDDLKSIAAARRAAETAFEAYRAFLEPTLLMSMRLSTQWRVRLNPRRSV